VANNDSEAVKSAKEYIKHSLDSGMSINYYSVCTLNIDKITNNIQRNVRLLHEETLKEKV
jgi:hypothetical protein